MKSPDEVSMIRGSWKCGAGGIYMWPAPVAGSAGCRLNPSASGDTACVRRACQVVSNEPDGFNNSLQLDCDFTMWRWAQSFFNHRTWQGPGPLCECCVLCKRADRFVKSKRMSVLNLFTASKFLKPELFLFSFPPPFFLSSFLPFFFSLSFLLLPRLFNSTFPLAYSFLSSLPSSYC